MSTDHRYKPRTFGLGFKLSPELFEQPDQQLVKAMDDRMRILSLATDVEMGVGLNNDDAKFLLAQLHSAETRANERPAPTMTNTVRKWLAAKIRPTDPEDYE